MPFSMSSQNLRSDLPASFLAVMHQAPHHVDGFAHYLNQCSQLEVKRGCSWPDIAIRYLLSGRRRRMCPVLCAKRDSCVSFLKAAKTMGGEGPIDAMMTSLADTMAESAAGVILTGADMDGIKGFGKIKNAGGTTFVQDPASSLYKETPSTVAEKYGIDFLVSDKQMAGAINSFLISKCK